MQPLPAVVPDLGSWHRVYVHRDCHVQFDQGLYSVPFTLVGKVLWLRATDTVVALFEDHRLEHTHARVQRPGQRRTVAAHMPAQAQAFFAHDRNWCMQQASQVGPSCVKLIESLLSNRICEQLRAAQRILNLDKRYGAARLKAVCTRALAHASAHYRTVKTILSTGADRLPPIDTVTPAVYRSARFARSAVEMFAVPALPLGVVQIVSRSSAKLLAAGTLH